MKALLLAAYLLMSVTTAWADECYEARCPNASAIVTAVVDGEQFSATYIDKTEAVQHAQNLGLCVRDYGVLIEKVNPITKIAVEWKKKDGFSVWRRK